MKAISDADEFFKNNDLDVENTWKGKQAERS